MKDARFAAGSYLTNESRNRLVRVIRMEVVAAVSARESASKLYVEDAASSWHEGAGEWENHIFPLKISVVRDRWTLVTPAKRVTKTDIRRLVARYTSEHPEEVARYEARWQEKAVVA